MTINFYTTKGPYGCFSNFYRASFKDFVGREWMTSEHFYQAQKASDSDWAIKIMQAPTPKEAARLGRSINIRADWERVRVPVMLEALYYKFDQHPDLKEILLSTGDEELVECTVGTPRNDPVWGNGKEGEGQNLLGKLLMVVRSDYNCRRS